MVCMHGMEVCPDEYHGEYHIHIGGITVLYCSVTDGAEENFNGECCVIIRVLH